MANVKKDNSVKSNKELMIFIALVVGFALMGSAAGGNGVFSFAGLAIIIWIFWRGRKLI